MKLWFKLLLLLIIACIIYYIFITYVNLAWIEHLFGSMVQSGINLLKSIHL